MTPSQYTEQEARDILRRASEIELQERDFSDEHLRQMAEELGISEHALALAKEQHLAAREQQAEDAELAALQGDFDRSRKQEFRIHLMFFAVGMTLVVGLNLLLSPAFLWFFFPLFGWVAGLIGHYWTIQQSEGNVYDQQFNRWLAQHKGKRTKRLEDAKSPKSLGAG